MATYNGHNEDASGNILLSIGNGMAATLETGTKASQAYTKGALLYYNNRLCKATAAIAKSATLTIGTNIAYTTLGAELTTHLRASNGNEFYFDYKDGEPGYYPTSAKTASTFVPFGGSTPEKADFVASGLLYTTSQSPNHYVTITCGFQPTKIYFFDALGQIVVYDNGSVSAYSTAATYAASSNVVVNGSGDNVGRGKAPTSGATATISFSNFTSTGFRVTRTNSNSSVLTFMALIYR